MLVTLSTLQIFNALVTGNYNNVNDNLVIYINVTNKLFNGVYIIICTSSL